MRLNILVIVLLTSLFLSFKYSPENHSSENFPFYDRKTTSELVKAMPDQNDLYLIRDSCHNKLFYYSDIFTPVCEDNVCKPIEIRLFWDVCGNFLGFKIPSDKPLTKKDHVRFSNYEYYILYLILNNPNAEIGKINKSVLAKNNTDDVDAIAGATSSAMEQWVVSGAAYSTYTLWHWVNNVKEENHLKTDFLKISTDDLVKKCDSIGNMTVQELTEFLNLAEQSKLIKKYKFQKALLANLNSLPTIHALLINNYLKRIPILSKDIEKSLTNCLSVQKAFNRMLP